jgi:predicted transcriptional regulator of viral defense system
VERTLIDIAVRPEMAGGITEVINIYKNAVANFDISINRIVAYLNKLEFAYPYQQAIGFLLELAGFTGNLSKLSVSEYNFFLYHTELNRNLDDLVFNERWKIYFPKALNIS